MTIPAEVLERLRDGCDNEGELVGYIKAYLQTEAQREELHRLRLSIEDCLNGRYGGEEEAAVSAIYAAWNAQLGYRGFGS